VNRFIHAFKNITSQKTLTLSLSLAKTNFKLRNEGSYLGVLWYLLNPLSLFFTILFVKQTAFSHTEIPLYPVYLLTGLVLLSYLNRVVGVATDVIRGNSNFIKSIHIKTEALVISSVMHILMLHVFEVFLIICLSLYFQVPVINLILYIGVTLLFTLFLSGLAFLFATIGVYVTDVGNVWAVVSQLIFFVTPTFYVLSPASGLYTLNLFNPLYYFMTLARDVLIHGQSPLWLVSIAIVSTVVSLALGLFVFSKYRRSFAEWL
jgi:ABC-type polysaccharide/polyol phosphate export permease